MCFIQNKKKIIKKKSINKGKKYIFEHKTYTNKYKNKITSNLLIFKEVKL